MAPPTQQLTAANFARIFVALQRALSIAPPRNANAPLLQPDNIWALSVLLGERAYWAANPPAEDYRLAVQTLGPLAGGDRNGPIWLAVVEAGDASDRSDSLRAAEKLAAQLAKVGVDLVAGLATSDRLSAFRAAAQRISPQPSPLPTLDSLFGPATGEEAIPAVRTIYPVAQPRPNKGPARALVYGVPVLGALTLLAGAICFAKKRGVQADGR